MPGGDDNASAPDVSGLAKVLGMPIKTYGCTRDTWPPVSEGSFELPTRAAAKAVSLSVWTAAIPLGILMLTTGSGLIKLLGVLEIVLAPVLVFLSWRQWQKSPGLTLTSTTLTYHDGLGTIAVAWSYIARLECHDQPSFTGPARFARHRQVLGIHAPPELVVRTGMARKQNRSQRMVLGRADVVLLPWTFLGRQELVVHLVAWSALPANRPLIGTEAGRFAFWTSIESQVATR